MKIEKYINGDSITDHRFSSHSGRRLYLPYALTEPSNVDNFYHYGGVRTNLYFPLYNCGDVDEVNDRFYRYLTYYNTPSETIYENSTINKLTHIDFGNNCMIDKNTDNTSKFIEGVPADFINSFGNFLGLKFFLEGVNEKKDVFTYIDKNISSEDFEIFKRMFNQCRFIYKNKVTEHEFYDPNIGYAVLSYDESLPHTYNIICAIGYSDMHEKISKMGNDIKTSPMASWVTGIDSYGDLNIKTFSLQSIHPYQAEFYPFMKGEDIADFAKRYMESTSSILLLIGPPGTAKTNFIRQLLQQTNESVLLTYSDDLKRTDKLFSYFYDSPEKFLIIEDADTYIEKREDGNTNMKQVLNITDGLTANPSKKVIFSTNLPSLSRVDPALVRPGRCFDKLQFGRLKDNDLLAAMNIIGTSVFNDVHIPQDGFTIAELFAIKNNEPIDIVETSSSFGFNK